MELQHVIKRAHAVTDLIGIAAQSLATPVRFAWRALPRPHAKSVRSEDKRLEDSLAKRGGSPSVRRDLDRAVEEWMNEGGSGAGRSS